MPPPCAYVHILGQGLSSIPVVVGIILLPFLHLSRRAPPTGGGAWEPCRVILLLLASAVIQTAAVRVLTPIEPVFIPIVTLGLPLNSTLISLRVRVKIKEDILSLRCTGQWKRCE